tara:strand:+ start:17863 stop:18273 length:411 start_codon:yes stop_codon:yes gene_type:complete
MNTENSINIISRQFEVNDLTRLYFSNHNVELLQDEIRKYVYYYKDIVISKQSYDDLKIIMRSTFILNKHKLTGYKNTMSQVKYLNKLVILECCRIIIPNLEQHLTYRRDIKDTLNIQSHPRSTSIKGTKSGEWIGT